jgi:hypothetical protein
MDTFCYAMKSTACTLAHKAEFYLTDFGTSKQQGIEEFTLVLSKCLNIEVEQWIDVFETEGKSFRVLGMLEKN